MENNQKLTVNTQALIRHISYRLHTIVRIWPAPARPGTIPDRFCARKDYDDTILTEDLFFRSSGNGPTQIHSAGIPCYFQSTEISAMHLSLLQKQISWLVPSVFPLRFI